MHFIRGFLLVFLLVLFASVCIVPIQAQTPETIEKFTKGPHIGPAEEALVGIEVIHTAPETETVVRHGNGFLLRCDGFVLLPSSLFVPPKSQEGKVTTRTASIFLSPGTEK